MPEDTNIVFQELPDHISLTFSLTGCGGHCRGCHSPYLQDPNNGIPLTTQIVESLLEKYEGYISAVVFFEGVHSEKDLIPILELCHSKSLVTAMYTGKESVSDNLKKHLDFLKTGPYIEELGGLSSFNTNQRMVNLNTGEDITYKFKNTLGE